MSAQTETKKALLSINDLVVEFPASNGVARAVNGVSLDLQPGETLALVGESGSGKTALGLSILGLVPEPGRIAAGSIFFDGKDLTTLGDDALRAVRGKRISMIFQDPLTSLNPYLTVGRQITEITQLHLGLDRQTARRHAIALLERVGISDPERRIDQHPHEFSGGMRQRVGIAIAIACNPDVIIADEPTTALDVTLQAQILDLLLDIRETSGTSILLVTHDLAVVANYADRVLVMYAGKVMEQATTAKLFNKPSNPYTIALIKSLADPPAGEELYQIGGMPPTLSDIGFGCAFRPRCERAEDICSTEPPFRGVDDGHYSRCHFATEI